MIGAIFDVLALPHTRGVLVVLLVVLLYVAWRQFRSGRARRQYYRHRERQRREYWGWD